METVKKLSEITHEITSDVSALGKLYPLVMLEVSCRRHGRVTYVSPFMAWEELRFMLPGLCRKYHTMGLGIRIKGHSLKIGTKVLRKDYILEQEPIELTPLETGGYLPPLGGLDARQTTALMNKAVSDELLRKEYERLKMETADLRSRIAALQEDIEQKEKAIAAKEQIEYYMGLAAPFAPLLAQLFGKETPAGKAVSGLGNTTEAPETKKTKEATEEEGYAASILALARELASNLTEKHRKHLYLILHEAREKPDLLFPITRHILTMQETAAKASPAPKPPKSDEKKS